MTRTQREERDRELFVHLDLAGLGWTLPEWLERMRLYDMRLRASEMEEAKARLDPESRAGMAHRLDVVIDELERMERPAVEQGTRLATPRLSVPRL